MPEKITDGGHVRFDNVVIEDGNIRTVKGRTRLNTSAHSDTVVNGFFYYRNQAGTVEKLIVAESDELVTYDLDGTNRTSIASSLTNSSWDAVQIGNTIYFTNETDGIYKWSGTGSATAISGVSTPSSVNFSASTTVVGGLTKGTPIAVAANIQSDGTCSKPRPDTEQCQIGLTCILLGSGDAGGTDVTSDDGTIETTGDDSTYSYKVVFYNNQVGIESEASSADTATLNGDDHYTWSGNGCYACDPGNSTPCNSVCCSGIDVVTHGGETATTGTISSASSPFNTVRVYRTVVGGSGSYFLAGEQTSGVYTDGAPDNALGPTLDTTIDTIDDPSFKYIENYKGTIFVAENNLLRFTRVPVELGTDFDKYWLETDKITVGTEKELVTGLHKTTNSLLIFTRDSIQELTGFGASSFRLQTIADGVGTVSDKTIKTDTNGDIIFFAGSSGVYKLRVGDQPTDSLTGNLVGRQSAQFTKISSPDLDDIFTGQDSEITLSTSDYATSNAYYDAAEDRYFLFVGNHAFIFDALNATWSHVSGIQTSASLFVKVATTSGQGYLLDNLGFMYKNWIGYTTSVSSGTVTGNPTASTGTTLTDSLASFYTTDSGLTGQWVIVDNGTSLQYRRISSNTGTELTISPAWTVNPTTSNTYYVSYIIPDIITKRYGFVKPPDISDVQYFILVHNKAETTQNLTLYKFREKGVSPESGTFTIDLSQRFVDKKGSNVASSWVQWQMRTFIYNTSNTIDPPLDIENYTVEVVKKEHQ